MIEWFTAAELAAMKLPGVAATTSGVKRAAKRLGWDERNNVAGDPLARPREGRGGGVEYHYTLLPSRAQAVLVRRNRQSEPGAEPARRGRAELWDWYDRQPETKKRKAKERLQALIDVKRLRRGGIAKNDAVCEVARQKGVGASTIYSWMDLVAGLDDVDWLPALAPVHAGRTATAEIDPAALDYIKADWLTQSKPSFRSSYERLKMVAAENGWQIPSYRTLKRRIEKELPRATIVAKRQGNEAIKKLVPPQERDRRCFHALEAVNIDGHKWDVAVRWPDGTVDRPMMVAIQDLYSNKILGWRLDLTENADAVRLAFKDVFEQYGIPDHCWMDNGRAFASKAITGGSTTRFRGKTKREDPVGILTALDVEIHWTLPYSGQSKPIERAFRDLCDSVARHPAFEGAYVGNSPANKPENYGKRVIPLDEFVTVVDQGIRMHNMREGRRTLVCGGVKSFDQAFAESYAREDVAIRRAGPEQLRMMLLASEQIRADRDSGYLRFAGNRFWCEELIGHAGELLTIRFDPDDLHAGAHVYRLDGRYVTFADCIEAVGFADTAGAREQARLLKRNRRNIKERAALDSQMSAAEAARQIAAIDIGDAPPPQAKVVRLITGNTARAVAAEAEPEEFNRERTEQALGKALLRIHPGGRMD